MPLIVPYKIEMPFTLCACYVCAFAEIERKSEDKKLMWKEKKKLDWPSQDLNLESPDS